MSKLASLHYAFACREASFTGPDVIVLGQHGGRRKARVVPRSQLSKQKNKNKNTMVCFYAKLLNGPLSEKDGVGIEIHAYIHAHLRAIEERIFTFQSSQCEVVFSRSV